jgi:hypothetical protein
MNAGTALYIEATNPIEFWEDTKIYRAHCTPVGFHWVLGVSYRFSMFKPTFLAFDYMRGKGTPFSPKLREEYVEYISYPFFLGWLYIYEAICKERLFEWLDLISNITEARFLVLRAMGGQCLTKASDLGNALGVSEKTVRRHVEITFEELPSRGLADHGTGKEPPVPPILHHYYLFRF